MTEYPDYEMIRKCIKIKRIEQDITQEQLAEAIGKSSAYVSRLETGRDNPSLAMLYLLAIALKCSISDFLVAGAENSSEYLLGEITSEIKNANDTQRLKILKMIKLILQEDAHEN